jgi:hypothetical protein
VSGETAQAVQSILAIEEAHRKVAIQAKKVELANEQAAVRGIKGNLDLVGHLAGVVTAYGGVSHIIDEITKKQEHLIELQRRALEYGDKEGAARAGAILRMGGADVNWADQTVKETARKQKISSETLWHTFPEIYGSRGGLDNAALQSALSTTARVGVIAPSADLATFGKGLASLMQATGTDANSTVGWARTVGSRSKMPDVGDVMTNLAPAVAAGGELGWNPQQVATMTTYLSASGVRMSGKSSPVLALMQTLAADKDFQHALVPWNGPLKSHGPAAIGELQALWAGAPPELREKMASKFPGTPLEQSAFRGLISKDPKALALYASADKSIPSPTDPANAASFNAMFAAIGGGPTEGPRKFAAIGESIVEELTATQSKAAFGAAVREKTYKLLGQIPSASPWSQMAGYDIGTALGADPADAAIDVLKQTRRAAVQAGTTAGGFVSDLVQGRAPTTDPVLLKLDEMIAAIEEAAKTPQKVEISGDSRAPAARPGAQVEPSGGAWSSR